MLHTCNAVTALRFLGVTIVDSANSPGEVSPFRAQTEYGGSSFKRVKLEASQVSGKEFDECVFTNCSFRETIFKACKFSDCTFQECNLSLVRFEECSFNDTKFERSTVSGVDWTIATWSRFQAESPICFYECEVDFSAFIGLALRKIVFQKCSAQEVEFSDADLSGANFSGTNLARSRFRGTNLTRANFESATHYAIDVSNNKITKARFSLPEALSLLYGLDIVLVE
jgi:fluoroquinolone resistance protein